MPKKSKTSYFTSRGKYFGNLWATYSYKTGKILRLGSDRQLAHWLLHLEFNPCVVEFGLRPDSKDEYQIGVPESLSYHFIARPKFGPIELHFLRISGVSADFNEKASAAVKFGYSYQEFDDEHWFPHKSKILPLLRVSSFLSGNRNLYIPPGLIETAKQHILIMRQGSLRSFMSAVSSHDKNLCLLVFCQMYAKGFVRVNFETSFFSLETWWWINEE
jgi:hypothetical protein